ncbi:MAG: DUF4157 domain-containing protein [Calditrichaceae bacterium]|nr:DUF4157 domain-containing protein [Calditrichaceae bacterium]
MGFQHTHAQQNHTGERISTAKKPPEAGNAKELQPGPQLTPAMLNSNAGPLQLNPQNILYLHRKIGNRATGRLIQAKLAVGPANDKYEQEADRVAEQVIRMPEPAPSGKPAVQRQPHEEEPLQAQPLRGNAPLAAQITPLVQREAAEEEPLQGKLLAQRAVEEEEMVQGKSLAQRAAEEEAVEEEEMVQGKSLAQRAAEEEEMLQGKLLAQRAVEEEEPLQAKPLPAADTASVSAEGDATEARLLASKGKGRPLPEDTRAFMETRFGSDFSGVRIHTGGDAAQMSRELNARAFAHGSDVYFHAGEFDPGSMRGKALLAHELAHTIQQGASPLLPARRMVQRQEEAGEEAIDVEAELRESREEAAAAADPRPAAVAAEEAKKEHPEAGEETPEEAAAGIGEEIAATDEVTGEKKTKKGRKAPPAPAREEEKEEEAPKGEAGQYLEAQSAGVCEQAAEKAAALAENEQTHDEAGEKLEQSEAAVEPPAEEGQAQSNAEQVAGLDEVPAPEADPEEAQTTLDQAIEQSVPRKLNELNEFQSKGKAKIVGSKVLGKVKEDADAVTNTYGAIEEPPAPKPPESAPVELPEEEPAPETPLLNLGKDAVAELPPEHTDFSEFEQKSDDLLEKEEISEEQLEMVDEGDLAEAKQERQGLKQKVAEEPAQIREFAEKETQEVEQDLQQEEAQSKTAMKEKRSRGLADTRDKQEKTKSELEKKREEVTGKINQIYENAKKSVTEKLNKLEQESLKRFDQAQETYSKEFEIEVTREVDAWKRKRYSGFWGPAKWLKDKFVGIDGFPEVQRAFDNAKTNYVAKIDRLIAEITADNNRVIEECKAELAKARQEIKEFVDGLGPALRETGQNALKDMEGKLSELDQFIDRKKEELAQKLCDKKEEAIKKIDEKIEKMKEAMSGALAKLGNLLLKAALKFFEWVLKKAGFDSKKLMSIINKGAAVIKKIVTDPVGFIKNLIGAVKLGVENFVKNIKKHLVGGLVTWLTGAMGDVGIQLPEKFDLKGVLSIVLQILGLTWNAIRFKLVKRLGEKVVKAVETGVDIVKRIVTEGPMALWEMIKEKAAELKQQVMEGIRNWVVVQVVKQAVIKLLSFLNPAGAIVQAVLAIYNTIMFFVENWQRIVDFVKSVFDSIGNIVMGKVQAAANFIEQAMAKTVPIILNFLARCGKLL